MIHHDAVVIGAGHNGLAAAAHLATKGWDVGVYEAADRPGGAVKTLELTEPGFRHDFGASSLSFFAASAFFRAHGPELFRHGMQLVPVSECFATVFPDGRWLGISTDLEETTARIAKFSERDAAAWERLVGTSQGSLETLFRLLDSPVGVGALSRLLVFSLRRNGVAGSLELVRFLLSSSREWLDGLFESDELKALLGSWGMYFDLPPEMPGGAIFPFVESVPAQTFGMALGGGGSATMVDALVAMVRAHGGVVECGAPVERIETAGGRARAVTLADGRRIEARRAVIGGVAPRALAGLLPGGTGDEAFDRRMAEFRYGPGTMMIHLAVDELPDWPDLALRRFAYVHLAPSLTAMDRAYTDARAGLLPAEPVVFVGQPTAVDPSRAPEGQHVLWLLVRVLPAEVLGDAAGILTDRDWEALREPYADRVLDLVETYAPGLRARIRSRRVMTPLDLEAEDANLVGGDQTGGSLHLAQNFLFRPGLRASRWRTPVKGLHLTGAATWPGAGTGAGPGFMLARELAGRWSGAAQRPRTALRAVRNAAPPAEASTTGSG